MQLASVCTVSGKLLLATKYPMGLKHILQTFYGVYMQGLGKSLNRDDRPALEVKRI